MFLTLVSKENNEKDKKIDEQAECKAKGKWDEKNFKGVVNVLT